MLGAIVQVPYPSWLNPADNTWQIIAATFVGSMSLPALAVLYASIVPKKWAVNVLAMMFAGFSLVLIAWVLWTYKMGFGGTSLGGGVHNGVQTQLTGVGWVKHFFDNFVGKPGTITTAAGEQGQAVSAANTVIPFHFPTSSLAYFQFVFAAITPLLFLGSVLGRIKFLAWCLLVPLWSTFCYGVNAFMLWGGGYFAQEGALDFSGGYVIHMSAGVSGFVAAWVLGPTPASRSQECLAQQPGDGGGGCRHPVAGLERLQRWRPVLLGSQRGRGRDQHQPGHRHRRHDLDGHGRLALQSEETHLPGRGERHDLWPGGHHALRRVGQRQGGDPVGAICTAIVWIAWNYLSKVRPFSKVDDALGVIYTHGIAGFFGGMLLGHLRRPEHDRDRLRPLDARPGQVVGTSQAPICRPEGTARRSR